MHSWETARPAGLGPLRFEKGASPDQNAARADALSPARAAEVALVIAPSFNVHHLLLDSTNFLTTWSASGSLQPVKKKKYHGENNMSVVLN